MTKAERDAKLLQLRVEVISWAKKERERYVAERQFLQAVLSQSVGGPVVRADELSKLTALAEVAKLVELK